MAKLTKRMKAAQAAVQPGKIYGLEEALKIVKDNAKAKFAESVDVAVRLGIDAKKSDQGVRGSSLLPHGTGKTVRVAVFCRPAKRPRLPRLPVRTPSVWTTWPSACRLAISTSVASSPRRTRCAWSVSSVSCSVRVA